MEPAGSMPDARSIQMALDSEEHYRARVWQVHRFSGTPSRTQGFFRPRIAPYRLRKLTLRSFDRFEEFAVGSRFTSSGVVLLHRYANKPCYRGWRLSDRLLQGGCLMYTCERPGQRQTYREVGAQNPRAFQREGSRVAKGRLLAEISGFSC